MRMLLLLTLLVSILLLNACSDDESQRHNVNEACSVKSDCVDRICHQGICGSASPRPMDAPCSGPGECLSFHCASGSCAAGQRALDESCLYSEECAVTGLCAALGLPICQAESNTCACPGSGAGDARIQPDRGIVQGDFQISDVSSPCPDGQTECDGLCVDLQWDNNHCGQCNNACAEADFCSEGSCAGTL